MAETTNSTVTIKCVDHRHLLWSEICKFLDENTMVDVDLKCEGFVSKTHGLILAIFSPVLRERLMGCAAVATPSLDLDSSVGGGPKAKDVRHLVEFIYRGQVTLPREEVRDLLELAQSLRVSSLIEAIGKRRVKWPSAGEPPAKTPVTRDSANGLGRKRKRTRKKVAFRRQLRFRPGKNPDGSTIAVQEDDDDGGGGSPECEPCPSSLDEPQSQEQTTIRDRAVKVEDEEAVGESPGRLATTTGEVEAKPPVEDDDERQQPPTSKPEYRKLWRLKRPVLKCVYCAYETRDKGSFKSHVAKHDPLAERFVCDVCSKTFRSKRGFRCHQRGHSDPEQLHRCPHCDFHTPQKWSWLQHLAVIHRVDPRGNRLADSIRCTECDFACVAEHQLKAHQIRKHTTDKPFKCAECGYSAVVRYELDKHVSIKHRNERPYMCETCGFRSQTQSGFERHKRSHTGVKPFHCQLCGQAYADNRKLKSHLLRHAGDEKPFVCHLCGHACRRRDNLQMHLKRIHKTTMDAPEPLRTASASPGQPTSTDFAIYVVPGTSGDEPHTLLQAIYETACAPPADLDTV